MAFVCTESLTLVRVLLFLFFIYGFSSNNERVVSGRKVRDLAPRETWPNATIPYVIDCSIANVVGAKALIKEAMAEWEKRTCIRFVKRTNQKGYMLIRRFKGCWGHVGYRERPVVISIGDGCEYKYVMMHELGHVIGFHHEHQRTDRDEFIDILWDNVMNSMLKQFYKRSKTDNLDTGLPYDSSSIMHYRLSAFARNLSLSTIVMKDNTTNPNPYSYITDLDVKKTQEMYNCGNGTSNNESSKKAESSNNNNNNSKVVKETEKSKKVEDKKRKLEETNDAADVEVVEAVEVSLMSPGWFVNSPRERTASIMVNGVEMAKNIVGMNTVVFSYLAGKRITSIRHSIRTQGAGKAFGQYLKAMPRRHYFLMVSKAPSLAHLQEASSALLRMGIILPKYIQPGSSICIVGYKGKEKVAVKYVIGSRKEKAAFLSMNITLPNDYNCQNDVPYCVSSAKKNKCNHRPRYYYTNCQRSCGACAKGRPCEDEHPNCASWAKKQYCYSHATFMLKYCKVSCGICRKALPARVKGSKSGKKQKIVLVDAKAKKYTEGEKGSLRSAKNDDDDDENRIIGTRCLDKSKTCPDWAKAGRCKTDSWVTRHCLLSCDIKGSCDREQIKPEGACSWPLNIGWDAKLSDNAFTASSFYKTGEWNASAANARLYMEDDFKAFRIGAWCAKFPPKQDEWLKIDLGRRKRITAVATQGRFRYYEHVKTYRLSFSKNARKWEYYMENGRIKEFKGNCDHQTPVLNILNKSVIARFIKFHPMKYYEGVCMRVEVYGCAY